MKTRLLFPACDLDSAALPPADPDLVVDLELDRLFAAMAAGDATIEVVARAVLPIGAREAPDSTGAPEPSLVLARQALVADALANPAVVRELYRLASDAVEAERRVWGGALRNAELVLHRSVEVTRGLLDAVTAMRDLLARDRAALRSAALLGLADRLAADIDEAFLRTARAQLATLEARTLVVTAGLGPGNRAAGFTLRRAVDRRAALRERVGLARSRSYAVDVTLHDQNAMNALAELRARAVTPVAAALAESAAHLLGFCRRLRDETAFLVGCANLAQALSTVGVGLTMPEVAAPGTRGLAAAAIVDPCLALAIGGGVTPNDLDTVGCALTVITGANGGGKSTVLRAVGIAQLLLNAGMPVPAAGLRGAPADGVRVHFPRGEGDGQEQGRLDAELRRLSDLVDRVHPGTAVLLNEPLAAVNERDGFSIGAGLVRGLIEGGAAVWLVTHHHELAAGLAAAPPAPARFLRAERGEGGTRPYRLEPAPPLATSYGEDLWAADVGEGSRQAARAEPSTIGWQ